MITFLKKYNFFKIKYFIVFLIFSSSNFYNLFGQISGDYRTINSGDWNIASNWEKYNGVVWSVATISPTSANGAITINSGHTITVTANVTTDQLTVSNNAILIINSGRTLTLANGTGVDLTIDGTLKVDGILGGGASQVTVNGIITNSGTATAPSITFNSGSLYQHARNGGAIPYANWDTNSTCEITGVTNTNPSNYSQKFGNYVWNSNLTTSLSLGGGFADIGSGNQIKGDFRVINTNVSGGGSLRFSSSLDVAYISILGNLEISGNSTLIINPTGSGSNRQLRIGGDFIMKGVLFDYNADPWTVNNSDIYVSGNFTHTSGSILKSSSKNGICYFYFNGMNPQIFTSGGTVTNQIFFSVLSGSTLQMANSSTIVNGGSFTLNAGASLGITSPDGISPSPTTSGNIQTTIRVFDIEAKYIYNSNEGPQITGPGLPAQVHTLTIDNINGVTLQNAVQINTLLYLKNGVLNNSIVQVNMSPSATFPYIQRETGTLEVAPNIGNKINVIYSGSTPVNTHNELPVLDLLMDLTIDNIGDVTLKQNITVNGILTLSKGIFYTDDMNLLLMNDFSSVNCIGCYSDVSYIDGPIKKKGNTDFIFPTGNNGRYQPIGISSLSTTLAFTAQYFHSKYDNRFRDSSEIVKLSLVEYWTLNREDPEGSANVTLFWNNISGVENLLDLQVCKFCSTSIPPQWIDMGITTTSGSISTGSITTIQPVSSFSPFTLGSKTNSNPLPVNLINFKAKLINNYVELNWTTTAEINNDFFTIEKTVDFTHWIFVKKVDGFGNSNSVENYSVVDYFPLSGQSYYRLKQTDFNGNVSYSNIINVNYDNTTCDYNIIPNPFSNNAHFTIDNSCINDALILYIFTSSGKCVRVEDITKKLIIERNNLSDGEYYYKIFDTNKLIGSGKFIIMNCLKK